MKARIFFMVLWIAVLVAGHVSAVEGQGQHQRGETADEERKSGVVEQREEGTTESGEQKAVDVGNKICPVSGMKIGSMGKAVQYTHEGNIYNFCCAGCIGEFKTDPEKYIEKINVMPPLKQAFFKLEQAALC